MQRTYPEGVPSWIDLESPDLEGAEEFYGGLFGWTFDTAPGPGADAASVVARLHGRAAAGLGGRPTVREVAVAPTWNTYVAVADADAAVERITRAGGRVVTAPADVGDAGRATAVVDPSGAAFRLWQAGDRPGVQVVNEPGAWNFSDLHTSEPDEAGFYETVFGWEFVDLGFGTLIRCPGYGDHLAATVDPDIRERQASAITPPKFEDAIGWLAPGHDDPPHWHVTFTVADRDEAATTAERLGGIVLASTDTDWTQDALIRDAQGAVFTVSRFAPPAG
jgi:predicted enzyme related to lactoylglutathione lyase